MRSALLLVLLLGGCGAMTSPRLRFVSSVATEASWSFVVDDHGRGAEFLVDGRDRDVGCDRAGQELRCELRGMFPGGHTLELRLPGAVLRRSVLIGQPWPERVVLARVRDEGELEAAARAHVDGVILIGGDRLHLTAEAHKHSLRALLLPEELATLNETAADGIVGAPIPADQLARFPELRSFTVDRQRSDALEAQLLRGDSPASIIAAGDGLLDAQSLAGAALALGAPHGVIVNSVGFPLLEARRRHSALRRGEVAMRMPPAGLVQPGLYAGQ